MIKINSIYKYCEFKHCHLKNYKAPSMNHFKQQFAIATENERRIQYAWSLSSFYLSHIGLNLKLPALKIIAS